jgi:hypothetical protein
MTPDALSLTNECAHANVIAAISLNVAMQFFIGKLAYRRTDVSTYQRTDVPMYRCTDVPTYRCTDAPMHRCTDVSTSIDIQFRLSFCNELYQFYTLLFSTRTTLFLQNLTLYY